MTLIEKITKELETCKKEIAACDAEIAIANVRKECLKDKKEMLEELLENAQNEISDAPQVEAKLSKSTRKKKSVDNVGMSVAEETKPTVSMKALAEEFGVTITSIAKICTELGYNEDMAKNNNLLTTEQAEIVRRKMR